MRKRAEAENARMELFKHVIRAEAPSESGGALPLLPLQLEYFRRFHLNVQRLYFRERGEQHRRSVRRRFVWRCVALLLIVAAAFPIIWTLQGRDCIPLWIANCLTLLPSKGEFGQRVFLCLGLIGGALQGLLAAYSLMSYDERNCVRYRETSENLDDLASRPLDEARYAAATGDKQRVYAFYALVDEQISSEHREWVGLRTIARDLSLDRLRELRLPMVAN